MMNNTKTYITGNTVKAADLVNRLNYFFSMKNMDTTFTANQDGSIMMVQARVRGGAFKKIIGMDKAVTVRINKVGEQMNVEIGEAKWGDKAIVMTTSMFILWPLAITSGIGIAGQRKILTDTWREIDYFMLNANARIEPVLSYAC